MNNLGLKALSFLLAIVLWFLVVIADNPKDSVTFSNIQVALVNTELLKDKFYEILEGSDRIRVTVEAPKRTISELNASDIVAEADVSRLTEVNTIPISYRMLNDGVEILDITGSRDSVRLNVEDRAKRWVNVRCNVDGDVAEGYMVVGSKVDQTRIEVNGPSSAVDSISYAALEIDVSGATTNVSGNVDIRFYDAENKLIDDSNIVKNAETMHVEIQVLATKEVPVEAIPVGYPAQGYLVTGEVDCDPPTVRIVGTSSALAEIDSIVIPERELNVTGEYETVERTFDIRRYLDNASLADSSFSGRVTVTIHIEPIVERTMLLSQNNISVTNLPEGLGWEFEREQELYRLRLSGLDEAVSAVDQSAVRGTVDIGRWMYNRNMTELEPGVYEIPVSFELPEDVVIENEVRVRVNITETGGAEE